jgi:hypothetical protein
MKMSVMAVSLAAYRAEPAQVLSSLARVGAASQRLTLKVDQTIIGKRLPVAPEGVDAAALRVRPVVNMKALVRQEAGDYMPDEAGIADQMEGVTSTELLVVDASAFKVEVLLTVLHHMRRVLFAASEWPGSIAVVVRDEVLDEATALLTRAFYSTPSRTSLKEAAAYAHGVHRTATMARVFNWSQTATERAFTLKDNLSRRFMRLTGKDEVDLT